MRRTASRSLRLAARVALALAAAAPLAGGVRAGADTVTLEHLRQIGGNGYDRAQGCAVGPDGRVYLTGNTSSKDLPRTPGSLQGYGGGRADAWVAKLSPDLGRIEALTYLGGSGEDRGYGLAVAPDGSVVAVGISRSDDFPTTPGAFQRERRGDVDVTVSKLTPDLGRLVFATRIGGSKSSGTDTDWSRGAVTIGPDGSVTVAGGTAADDFPTTPGAYQRRHAGGLWDAFISRFEPDGRSLRWSTLVGGSGIESFYGNLVLHADGSVTAGGFTASPDFPVGEQAPQRKLSGAQYPWYTGDGALARISGDGSKRLAATLLWGSVAPNDGLALDSHGQLLLNSQLIAATAGNVPVTPGAAQRRYAGGERDMVVARLDPDTQHVEMATFFGGSGDEEASGIDGDASGRVFAAGNTNSLDLPITQDAFQAHLAGDHDGVVAVFGPDGALRYASYLGGPGVDRVRCLARTPHGFIVSGDSDGAIPGAIGEPGDGRDAFVAIFRVED